MKVTSTGILHGVISDEYGKRGTQFNAHGMPTYSLPLSIQDAPAGTVSYAIVLEDKDAYPVSGGFVWIHWTVANLTRTELEENESISATDFVQGANSWMRYVPSRCYPFIRIACVCIGYKITTGKRILFK